MSADAALVVMAAGMGSRFGGLKQAEPVGPKGEAILDFSVYDAKQAGFNKVVFVIKRSIEDIFKQTVGNRIAQTIHVEYVFQETDRLPAGYVCPPGREKPWGTGQAVLCCREVINTPFAVINADDYYGRSAFSQIYRQLCSGGEEYCMVGYRLGNTVTENGTVSRGVCRVKDGYLSDIEEVGGIGPDCHTAVGDVLDPETVVSMNMWGFGPDFFRYLEEDFTAFLDRHGKDLKAEFYLPGVVDRLIRQRLRRVRVLVAEDKWYGVTYKEDKPQVVSAIRALLENGSYPGM